LLVLLHHYPTHLLLLHLLVQVVIVAKPQRLLFPVGIQFLLGLFLSDDILFHWLEDDHPVTLAM
jgi:hypothetical protein